MMPSETLVLPSDLLECEEALADSLLTCKKNKFFNRLAVNLKFEGLKIDPVLFRLVQRLDSSKVSSCIAYSDVGSCALAKRDYPDISDRIFSFKDLISSQKVDIDTLIIAVSPQPYDFDQFEAMSNNNENDILMINGRLEETSIGVGLVGRERRVRFIKSWEYIFWLEPLPKGAIYRRYPSEWQVFKYTKDGYIYQNAYSKYPANDLLDLVLN